MTEKNSPTECSKTSDNVESVDDSVFALPASPKKSSNQPPRASRRSSVLGIVRRQSKSVCGGITFEDQIAMIDTTTPIGERLQRLVRLAASTALKTVLQESEEESDNEISEMIDTVDSEMRKKGYPSAVDKTTLSKVSDLVDHLAKCKKDTSPKHFLIPARVQTIRDYIAAMGEETEAWKKFMGDRKTEYQNSRKEQRSVSKGELQITRSEAIALCGGSGDDPFLQASNTSCALMQRLLQQEQDYRHSENRVYESLKRGKKRLADATTRVDVALKKIISYCDNVNTVDTEVPRDSSGKTRFAVEVETFLSEINE